MDDGQGVSWSVESQTEQYGVGANGQPGPGYLIYFVTSRGQRGSVFVDRDHYSPDYVRRVIADHAVKMDTISKLSG